MIYVLHGFDFRLTQRAARSLAAKLAAEIILDWRAFCRTFPLGEVHAVRSTAFRKAEAGGCLVVAVKNLLSPPAPFHPHGSIATGCLRLTAYANFIFAVDKARLEEDR